MSKETGDLIITLALIIGGLILLGLFIYLFGFELPKEAKRERLRKEKEWEEWEESKKEPEYAFFNAKVVGARKYVYNQMDWAMPMLPAQVDEYYATFLLEAGEEIEYKISEELFFTLTEGEEGTLVTVNGNFFDFGSGEEIASGMQETETVEE